MQNARLLRIAGNAPIVMSLIALALVLEGTLEFGTQAPADEGWQAHIFQLLMVIELPIIAMFAIAGVRSQPRLLRILAAQIGLWIAAGLAAYLFT